MILTNDKNKGFGGVNMFSGGNFVICGRKFKTFYFIVSGFTKKKGSDGKVTGFGDGAAALKVINDKLWDNLAQKNA